MLAFLQLHARCRVRNLLVIPNRMLPPHYDDVVSTQNFDKIPLQDALQQTGQAKLQEINEPGTFEKLRLDAVVDPNLHRLPNIW